MATKDKNKGFLSALKKAFNGGDVTPADPVVFTSGHSVVARSGLSALRPGILGSNSDGMTSAADSISLSAELPGERLQKYNILETMAKSPTISTALNIHIAHALAPSKKTGQAFILSPKDGSDAEAVSRCEELTADLGAMINDGLPSWAMIMAIFGVSYVRPYAEQGRGITGIESSYYTLPHFVQEFYRGSQLVGFSGDYILDTHSLRRVITEPWNLVSMKNPYLFTEQLHIDDDTLNTMIKEFKANESEQNNEHGMYESAPLSSGDDPENWTPEQLINFAKFVMSN